MEESLDDFNHKIDAGKSLYNSNKPEEESMGDYRYFAVNRWP